MSHVSKVAIEITDLTALAKAAVALGGELVLGQKTFKWFGKWMNDYAADDAAYKQGIKPEDYGKCEHAIRVPGAGYEIGVMKNPQGPGFVLVYDNWQRGQGLEKVVGKNCGKLVQQYGAEKAKAVMSKKGFRCQEKWVEGKLQVAFTKG